MRSYGTLPLFLIFWFYYEVSEVTSFISHYHGEVNVVGYNGFQVKWLVSYDNVYQLDTNK